MWYCVITGKGQEPRELTMACKVRRRRADAEHIRPEEILMETNEKEDLYDENLEQEDSDRLSGPDDVYRYGSANVCSASESVSPIATLNGWHYYRPYTVFDSRMAVSGSIGDGAEVKLKSKVNTTSQQFIARYAADGSLRIFSRLGYQSANPTQSYTLNVYRSGNWPCTMLRAAADNRSDSEVDFHTIDSISFRIYLPGRNVYLTQNGLNQNLTWGSYAEQYIKAWVQVAA